MESRSTIEKIFRAALASADPYASVASHSGAVLRIFAERGCKHAVMLAVGKAAPRMAEALLASTGRLIERGIIITKSGHTSSLDTYKYKDLTIFEAGHPVPDGHGLRATEEALRMLSEAGEDTLVVCLLSGGGSALLCSPANGISLEDKQALTAKLLASGADITELNAVRKHISKVKGGRLAHTASPAGIVSLIVSDVVGDSLEVIASGPTAPDSSTYEDAVEVLNKYSLEAPASVVSHLAMGLRKKIAETPKYGDRIFDHVQNIIVANNRSALEGAAEAARGLGLRAEIVTERLTGDVAAAAKMLAEMATERMSAGLREPLCMISGGETTVGIKGRGKGGRNMELALHFALAMEGKGGVTLLSAGTDGTDGPTEAAGAIVDGETIKAARDMELKPELYLSDNDSYHFFLKAGGLLVTGPTGTNVMDVQIMLLTP